ncbi:MAG: hypothetical protein M0Z61_07025 [Nitrospiraceae bacterium]|nr:hypothetical protein [Nitrospiraceae bacterium]
MARRKPYQEPKMAILTIEKMRNGILRLEKLIKDIEAFNPQIIQKRWSTEVKALEANIDGVLTSVFGHDTVEYKRYSAAVKLDNGPVTMRVTPFGGSPHYDDVREPICERRQGPICPTLTPGYRLVT